MAESAAPKTPEDDLLRMTADVVAAYVSNNTLATAQLADVINAVYKSLRGLEGQVSDVPSEPLKPAVPAAKKERAPGGALFAARGAKAAARIADGRHRVILGTITTAEGFDEPHGRKPDLRLGRPAVC